MFGSLGLALALTALGDTEAQAGRDPREHARLSAQEDPMDLRVLDWTLWNVSKYYVEPQRVDLDRLLWPPLRPEVNAKLAGRKRVEGEAAVLVRRERRFGGADVDA